MSGRTTRSGQKRNLVSLANDDTGCNIKDSRLTGSSSNKRSKPNETNVVQKIQLEEDKKDNVALSHLNVAGVTAVDSTNNDDDNQVSPLPETLKTNYDHQEFKIELKIKIFDDDQKFCLSLKAIKSQIAEFENNEDSLKILQRDLRKVYYGFSRKYHDRLSTEDLFSAHQTLSTAEQLFRRRLETLQDKKSDGQVLQLPVTLRTDDDNRWKVQVVDADQNFCLSSDAVRKQIASLSENEELLLKLQADLAQDGGYLREKYPNLSIEEWVTAIKIFGKANSFFVR
jgi:hypothetical protein